MSVYGSDQAGISTIQKSRRRLQFPQSKWGAGRKEEPYFSRFAREGKKLAAIGEEIAKRGIETGKAGETLLEKEYPLFYGKELLEEKNVFKPIESFKEIRKERYRRERRGKEVAKPSGKLDVEGLRSEEEGSRHWKNIDDLLSTFKQTGNLEPEEMLSLLESEKYAVEKKKEDLRREIKFKTINRVEEKYYKDIPSIPKGLGKLLQEEPLAMEEAKKSLEEFSELVSKYDFREELVKMHLLMLKKRT